MDFFDGGKCHQRRDFPIFRPGSEYDHLYESALCRQEADWLVGINGTRLFTVLYGGKALKVGRVQTPTLAMLVDRESKIMNFKKEAYYVAHIMGNGLDAVSEHICDKAEAEKIIAETCANGQALVTAVVKEKSGLHRRSSMTLPRFSGMPTVSLVLLQSRHWSTPRAFMRKS